MDFDIYCTLRAHESYDLRARSMLSQGEIEMRNEDARRKAEDAAREAAKRSVSRTKAARAFRAANRVMDRMNAPLALLRRSDDAERSIAAGVLPADLAALTTEMLAHR